MVPGALSSATCLWPSRVLPAKRSTREEAKEHATEDRTANKPKTIKIKLKNLLKINNTTGNEWAKTWGTDQQGATKRAPNPRTGILPCASQRMAAEGHRTQKPGSRRA